MSPTANDIELSNPPDDSISALAFAPNADDQLLVASWDGELRLYDVASNSLKSHFSHKAAVLGCCWGSDNKHAYSGGLDSWVRAFDLESETTTVLGAHTATISSIIHHGPTNTVYTGSWDQTVRAWDPRSPTANPPAYAQPERVYAMDAADNTLVVAMAGRLVNIYDLRMMKESSSNGGGLCEPTQRRESSLRFMTRTIACMSDGKGYAMSSVEGRIAVEYFDPSPKSQDKKYAFKCHRQAVDGVDLVWPVNSLAFHPKYNTFASAGSDGTVSLWDHTAKKRLKQYPKYASAVTAIGFTNTTGDKLAIGVSYAWDEGEDGLKREVTANGGRVIQVRIRTVGDECKPRGAK
ncbi:hypothetical protein FS837_005149 [Tulasnella sp. UAMH 9824]|nr:hypothetical protein FS837_005149 [Tulasnella sp. UAMH 9824]